MPNCLRIFDGHWWHDVKPHQKAIIPRCLRLYFQTAAHDLPPPFSCMSLRAIARIAVARSSLSPRARRFRALSTMSLVLPHFEHCAVPNRAGHRSPTYSRRDRIARKSAKDCPGTRRWFADRSRQDSGPLPALPFTKALLVSSPLFTICNPPYLMLIVMPNKGSSEIAGKHSL